MDKVYLSLPAGSVRFAMLHGADFDKKSERWFVMTPVPVALSCFICEERFSLGGDDPGRRFVPELKDGLSREWMSIHRLAARFTGSEAGAKKWLERPMVRLEGNAPKSLLGTKDGCKVVETLLRSLIEETTR